MDSDTVNISEDAEMTECEGDKVVTMMDVLQEQQEFEDDANAVLGASDDKNCTYVKGYIKRQALYACLTCCPDVKTDPSKRAGVCLACSLNCHENHDLVELYTKRNFRCDCGNAKFNSHPCQFTPSKPDLNDENIYNQNFSGLYCTCKRPYPDPEANDEEDMIQCIICEDWLHASHLNAVVPANDQYSEMICKDCMSKNEFLHDYTNFAVNIESPDVDVLTVNDSNINSDLNGDVNEPPLTNGETTKNLEAVHSNEVEMGEEKVNEENNEASRPDICEDKHNDESDIKDKIDSETENKDEQDSNEKSFDSKIDDESAKEQNLEEHKTEENSISHETEQSEPEATSNINTDSKDNNEQESSDTALTKAQDNESKEKSSETMEDNTSDDKKETIEHSSTTEENPSSGKDNGDQLNKSHENEDKINTSDDKSDAVMDAIDELLKDPADVTNTDNKDSSDQSNEPLSASKESVDDTGTQDKICENNDDPDTNKEISDNKSQDKTDSLTDNVETDTVNCNTEENGDGEIKDNTNETEVLDSGNKEDNTTEINPDDSNSKQDNVVTSESSINNSSEDNKNETIENKESDISDTTKENKRKLSTEVADTKSPKKAKFDVDSCARPRDVKKFYRGATFWPSNFRQKLCTCSSCLSMYKDLHVLFLTDPEDTVSAYENLGKENVDGVASQYEKGLQALSSLDRIQQINALTEYNRMRDKLLDFLKSFKDRKEIVKEEDIKAFFAGMKPKREPDGVYFCR